MSENSEKCPLQLSIIMSLKIFCLTNNDTQFNVIKLREKQEVVFFETKKHFC